MTLFKPTSGDDTFLLKGLPEKINGSSGSDTFVIDNSTIRNFNIDGGTNVNGDSVIKPVFFGTSLSTVKTTLNTPNASDTLKFNKTGIFTNLIFSNIEHVELADGITITLTNQQLDYAINSLNQNGINPGLHFYGVAGGEKEKLRVIIEYEEHVFTPASTVKDAIPVTYTMGDFQLDDAAIGDLFHDVINYNDFYKESMPPQLEDDDDDISEDEDNNSLIDEIVAEEEDDDDDEAENEEDDDDDDFAVGFFARADGSNNDDLILGSRGSDYATLRLGNDTYLGNEGNDLLVGNQGSDFLNGGSGNDIFLITSFGGVLGGSGKADDGNPEWIDGDVIVGGSGTDTLRITGGAIEKTTVTLTNDNFIEMEVIEIGATVGRLNVEDNALQLLNNHYYLNTSNKLEGKDLRIGQTADNIIVDASLIDSNGLTFIGNANTNTFIGTQKADTFIGNGGNDTFTGGAGVDKFIFGKVNTETVNGEATTIQIYKEIETDLTGVDTVTDFKKSGSDKIVLQADMFSALEEGLAEENLIIGTKAKDSDDYLIFNPATQTLSYDADGNGDGKAIDIVILLGIKTLSVTNFIIE